MKIMHVETGKHIYGGARQVLYLMQGLKQQGVENILVCDERASIVEAAKDSATVLPTRLGGDLDIGFIFRLKRHIKAYKPDVIHLHSRRGADWLGGIAAHLSHIPCVLSRRVDNPESRLITALKYRLHTKVVAISQGIGNVLLSQGLNHEKLRVIPSAVNTADYDRHYDRATLLSAFNLPKDAMVIGVIAQLIKRKGHHFLLDALPQLLQKHPTIKVLFFGQGPMAEELQERINTMGLADTVQLTGFRDDLHELIGALDIVAHPALMEGLGVSLLQAGAAGVPLIACNAGGMPEIVINQKTGLLINPGSAKELGTAVDTLCSKPLLREQYGQAAKAHVQAVFSVESMVSGNFTLYKHVLSAPLKS